MRRDDATRLDGAKEEVWKTATRGIPDLPTSVEPLLPPKAG